jgi:hypothetical protein
MPWARGGLTWQQEAMLLSILSRVDALAVDQPCWVFADPTRAPVLIDAEDIGQWLGRYEEGRAV